MAYPTSGPYRINLLDCGIALVKDSLDRPSEHYMVISLDEKDRLVLDSGSVLYPVIEAGGKAHEWLYDNDRLLYPGSQYLKDGIRMFGIGDSQLTTKHNRWYIYWL